MNIHTYWLMFFYCLFYLQANKEYVKGDQVFFLKCFPENWLIIFVLLPNVKHVNIHLISLIFQGPRGDKGEKVMK